MNIFRDIVKSVASESTEVLTEATSQDVEWIDTGSYTLNALVSGTIYGGISNKHITAYAGEQATGKTFFTLNAVQHFLKLNPNNTVFYFETENAPLKQICEDRGIDTDRIILIKPETVEHMRELAMKVLSKYNEVKDVNKPNMMFVLDSLGNLPTRKEIDDGESGSDKRDMTRAGQIRSLFRSIALRLERANCPMIVTNHTYEQVGCLVGETLVARDDGTFVSIRDLRIGDKVHTLLGPKPIEEVYHYANQEVFDIEMENGDIITCTSEHKFLVGDVWKKVSELCESDEIASIVFEKSV